MKKLTILAFILVTFQFSAQAQKAFGFGFKVGLNTSGVFGESELGADGENLETFGTIGGFQVGALAQLRINRLLGIRQEFGLQMDLLFSQKGTDYKYEGPSYEVYTSAIGAELASTGNRLLLVNATNGYLNIPVMAYAHITKNLNIGFGGYMDVLLSSTARGETQYSGILDNGSGDVEEHLVNYTYNYRTDEAGEAVGNSSLTVLVGSENITIPSTEGAYYDWDAKDGNYYKPLDFGLVGNIGWRFQNGLRFDVRMNYGMTDVTNNFYDVSLKERNSDGSLIMRSDFDRSVSYQVSIGFGF